VLTQLAENEFVESQQLLNHDEFAEVETCAVHLLGKIPGQREDAVEVRILHVLRVDHQIKKVNVLRHLEVDVSPAFMQETDFLDSHVVVDHGVVQHSHFILVRVRDLAALLDQPLHCLLVHLLIVAHVIKEH
jgi:autonomous glycyl radical cofactor GrcA